MVAGAGRSQATPCWHTAHLSNPFPQDPFSWAPVWVHSLPLPHPQHSLAKGPRVSGISEGGSGAPPCWAKLGLH